MRRFTWPGCLVAVSAVLVATSVSQPQGSTRYVNASDPTCHGHAPCYATIQAAVTAAQAGDRIVIQPGTYVEQVNVTGKNSAAGATEADRILIEADPEAPSGSVVLDGSVSQCTNGHAVRFQQSKFVTLRGLTLTGAGGQAVALMGGNNGNQAIHLERLRIFGNGGSECHGGITVNRDNPDTLIANSLIYANGRNGVTFLDADGGPHYLIGNTIHGNAWSGVSVARNHETWLINNAITGNGTASGSTGGRFGVSRESSTNPEPAGIHLLNNLICGNRLGEINGPALDATDAGNLTPSGSEGPGVTASPGCEAPATIYASLSGADGQPGTADDDFALAAGAPAIDRGLDPRTLGLPVALNPIFEADYQSGTPVRPHGTAFDIGARESGVAGDDTQAPTVTFETPAANAHVRQTVTVTVLAEAAGSGVAAVTVTAAGQALAPALTPTPPAPAVTATAAWGTTTVPDGAQTLSATAIDAAGQSATVTRSVVVDNTPPDTEITAGPSGSITTPSATFTFGGSDNLTPSAALQFAWRLDDGPWSAFGPDTSATLSGLIAGSHHFDVKARDLAGNEDVAPASRIFSVGSAVTVTITEPIDGAVVGAGPIIIRGTAEAGGAEVTVSVNGVPAAVVGPIFVVLADIDSSVTMLQATAETPDGQRATHSINVSVTGTPPADTTTLRPFPEVGQAPLAVTFSILPTPPSGTVIELDLVGNGTIDFSGATLDGQLFTYSAPGIYLAAATVVDGNGVRTTVRALVQVLEAAALDTLLRAKWQAMKDALRSGDIARAVTYIVLRAQDGYATVFQTIASQLPGIDGILTHIAPVEVRNRTAIYRMLRVDAGVTKAFEVRFVIDGDGLWRIQGF